ncbi:ferrous iron transport protein B [Litorilituus lipolyticus]|uniref:Ferrous iron transport protein B n=1 Tax=Litorilituus lipolyticus TaxID=2491017 RepID=A0A502KKW9_9GAMM|nr:ferrous iron transport protein B [Litorilituus lipolyticus]TPH12248.1 ferrous iron transport protein B [Litorilituus lipolyticus]
MSTNKHFALVGYANSGKSTLFNALLQSSDKQSQKKHQQKVGNWSGVTVAAKKSPIVILDEDAFLSDLPGISSLNKRDEQGQDLTISHQFIENAQIDVLVNVIDVNQLSRQLYLTSQLLELGIPVLVVLNKADSPEEVPVDIELLSSELGCPVIAMSAKNDIDVSVLSKHLLELAKETQAPNKQHTDEPATSRATLSHIQARHDYVADVLSRTNLVSPNTNSLTDKLDNFILHPMTGIPVFLMMMYLLFMFAINVGGAFIDFFDILSGFIFVTYPSELLSPLNLPAWLSTIIEGFGAGIQTVATFVPVIACLFIGLSLLESSGYLARAAFVVDTVMQKIGLPGKAFVPLIVGFGCTVPAVMSARVLDSERERITTVMMSPFMSCGARLPVYALFAAAFFPDNGQNLVFLLYLIGIAAALFTGFLLKATVLSGTSSLNIMELPQYELPKLLDISKRVWQRTAGFVTGAGKTIVIVVCLLNFLNSIGTDGEFGHQDSEQSILSEGAKIVMPALAPMGVKEENWQAGVGIITGIFAKEVLVATFNSLYSPVNGADEEEASLSESWHEALASIKQNLLGIAPEDPLGISVGEVSDLSVAAVEQDVEVTTYHVMQTAFAGQLGAFCYLLFILLYTPCVAAMGAIKNEVGSRWAAFAGIWSFVFAYLVATICYQLGSLFVSPLSSMLIISIAVLVFIAIYFWLKSQGKKVLTIPVTVNYS